MAAIGPVLAFMMSVLARGLPEMILRGGAGRGGAGGALRLLALFAAVFATGIAAVGCRFNVVAGVTPRQTIATLLVPA